MTIATKKQTLLVIKLVLDISITPIVAEYFFYSEKSVQSVQSEMESAGADNPGCYPQLGFDDYTACEGEPDFACETVLMTLRVSGVSSVAGITEVEVVA